MNKVALEMVKGVKANYSDYVVVAGGMNYQNADGLMNVVSQNKRIQRETDLTVMFPQATFWRWQHWQWQQ
jgi:hypothetical protein